jgi:hypothetical protein
MNDVFKKRRYVCLGPDEHRFEHFSWESEGLPTCPECKEEVEIYYGRNFFGPSSAVIGDEIDIQIRHGICNDDGTPRRFRSKAEMRKVAREKGLVIYGETPNLTSKQQEEEAEWQQNVNKKWQS